MKKITFYKLNGQIKSTEVLTKENLIHISGMMTKCYLTNGTEKVGFAYPTGVHGKEKYDGKIHDYIYLWTWDNLDEDKGELIGNDDEKYNQTFEKVKIDDIEKVETIIYSNPRWGGKLTNKFEFYNRSNQNKELHIPKFLKEKMNDKEDNTK